MNYCFTLLIVSVLGMFSPAPLNNAVPLNLKWGQKSNKIEEIKNFRYWFGDQGWGTVVYVGTKDLDGFSTELHLEYVNKKLAQATLILGSAGLNQYNCIRRYKRVIKLLNKKYSHFLYQKEIKDPLIEELIYSRKCSPIALELLEYGTFWKTSNFQIELWLFGNEEEVFIEIDYIYLSLKNKLKDLSGKDLLESL